MAGILIVGAVVAVWLIGGVLLGLFGDDLVGGLLVSLLGVIALGWAGLVIVAACHMKGGC